MSRLPALRHGHWIATLLVLTLALAGVLTGVSWDRVHRLGNELERLDDVAWPSMRAVHHLAMLVDEARGMEALLLLADGESARGEIEQRLQRQRQRIDDRLALQTPRIRTDADRRHLTTVSAALAQWWQVQDRVLSASRGAIDDPRQARQARELLAGESQLAYRRLLDSLEAWWKYHDDLSTWAASKARTELLIPTRGLIAVTGVLLLFSTALALLARAVSAPARPPTARTRATDRADRRLAGASPARTAVCERLESLASTPHGSEADDLLRRLRHTGPDAPRDVADQPAKREFGSAR